MGDHGGQGVRSELVRPPAGDGLRIDYAPSGGRGGGIKISMVRGPEEVEQVVRRAKFWPLEERV